MVAQISAGHDWGKAYGQSSFAAAPKNLPLVDISALLYILGRTHPKRRL
jgi:hypothetical protein